MKHLLGVSVFVVTVVLVLSVGPVTSGAQCPCVVNCPAGDGGITNPPPPGGYKSPDMNGSTSVDLVDLSLFAGAFPPAPYDYCADFNCDGIVNIVDLSIFAAHWLHAGPQPGFCQPGVDHYKTYETAGPIIDGPLRLRDQFGQVMVSPLHLQKFATPVSKNNQMVCDTLAHQSWWQFHAPDTFRVIEVQDQFGRHEWTLGDAAYLIAPALKFPRPGQEIPVLNHYKCYEAEGPPLGIDVRLVDQFGTETVAVLFPKYFCNPCEKETPDGVVYPIVDFDAHLAVYWVENPEPHNFQVLFRDQFTEEVIILNDNFYLCLPAVKRHIAGTGDSTE